MNKMTEIAKSRRPFAVVWQYSNGGNEHGEVLSTHKSYELACKAQRRSGYRTFLAVRDARDYA